MTQKKRKELGGGTTKENDKRIKVNVSEFERKLFDEEVVKKNSMGDEPKMKKLLKLSKSAMAAPVLRLDELGRERDEYGNVVVFNRTKPHCTLKVNINLNRQKQQQQQLPKEEEILIKPKAAAHVDPRIGFNNNNKFLRPKRVTTFRFFEQPKKLKAKQPQFSQVKKHEHPYHILNISSSTSPNLIQVSAETDIVFINNTSTIKEEDPIPVVMEWWDLPLLDGDGDDDDYGSIGVTVFIEHPAPIEPPVTAEPPLPPPQPLILTKQEKKKLSKQTRLRRELDKQAYIRDGLIQPPKPKLKLTNFMKVVGSEAALDPTRVELGIRDAANERVQAHLDRNTARKNTPAECRVNKERRLFDDPANTTTLVSLYRIDADLSADSQTRFKVEKNAQQNRLTGCGVILDGITIVVVEGKTKSIKRYEKLMLKRINWDAPLMNHVDEVVENKPVHKCVLVWQGSVAKPNFNGFSVHNCRTEAAARKLLSDAGVVHYWDSAVHNNPDYQI